MPIFIRCILLLACYATLSLYNVAFAAESLQKPHQVIADLRQRMYAIGETTGRFEDFIGAEQKAAADIKAYMVNGDQAALIEKNQIGQTPLMAAAFMGYSEVVSQLLKSDNVRNSIEDTNAKGMTAWLYANLAYQQTMWACNPTAFKDPFTWVPLFVTQPYYLKSAENPYRKTRRLLEQSGAKIQLDQVKQFWQDNCIHQEERTRSKVQKSHDTLETLLTEGPEVLARFIAEQQSKRRESLTHHSSGTPNGAP